MFAKIISKLKQRTTLAAIVAALATVARELGVPVSQGTEDAIVFIAILAIGFFAKDDSAK